MRRILIFVFCTIVLIYAMANGFGGVCDSVARTVMRAASHQLASYTNPDAF